jgi:hypothetical protein
MIIFLKQLIINCSLQFKGRETLISVVIEENRWGVNLKNSVPHSPSLKLSRGQESGGGRGWIWGPLKGNPCPRLSDELFQLFSPRRQSSPGSGFIFPGRNLPVDGMGGRTCHPAAFNSVRVDLVRRSVPPPHPRGMWGGCKYLLLS